MKTSDELINDTILAQIISREGGFVNDKNDLGGRTDKGISERSHPGAWKDGKITLDEATEIYRKHYLVGPGFDKIVDPRLRHQLCDWSVNSGPAVAIQKLQFLLKQPVDGILGPKTLAAANASDPIILGNKLALERVKMIGRIVGRNPSQSRFLSGWIQRALEFIHL